MVRIKKIKCNNCGDLFAPDVHNVGRQQYCRKKECRKASKAESQRRWLNKPENRNYFSGPENVKRVQQWRKANPGYWRRKPSKAKDALQDSLMAQVVENKEHSDKLDQDALQDFLIEQPPVLLGLIANFTGNALQDDIATTYRRLQKLGQDIVFDLTRSKGGQNGRQGSHCRQSYPESPPALQLDRSPPGAGSAH